MDSSSNLFFDPEGPLDKTPLSTHGINDGVESISPTVVPRFPQAWEKNTNHDTDTTGSHPSATTNTVSPLPPRLAVPPQRMDALRIGQEHTSPGSGVHTNSTTSTNSHSMGGGTGLELRTGGVVRRGSGSSGSAVLSSARMALAACKSGRSGNSIASPPAAATTPGGGGAGAGGVSLSQRRFLCGGEKSGGRSLPSTTEEEPRVWVGGGGSRSGRFSPSLLSATNTGPTKGEGVGGGSGVKSSSSSLRTATTTAFSAKGVNSGSGDGTSRPLFSTLSVVEKSSSVTSLSSFSSNENGKYLQELQRRRREKDMARRLPNWQKREQLKQAEHIQRTALHHEEQNAFTMMGQKKAAELLKYQQEALKKSQEAELAALKQEVSKSDASLKEELKERLKCLILLVPEALEAALTNYKQEGTDLSVIGKLLEEETRLRKGIKTDSCQQNSRNEEVNAEGGAFPFWLSQCLVSQFNTMAILKEAAECGKGNTTSGIQSPDTPGSSTSTPPISYRAVVMDVPNMPIKLSHRKRIFFVLRKATTAAPGSLAARVKDGACGATGTPPRSVGAALRSSSSTSSRQGPGTPSAKPSPRPPCTSSHSSTMGTREDPSSVPSRSGTTKNPLTSSSTSSSRIVWWGRAHSLTENVGSEEKAVGIMEEVLQQVKHLASTARSPTPTSSAGGSSSPLLTARGSASQEVWECLSRAVEEHHLAPTLLWCKEDFMKLSSRYRNAATQDPESLGANLLALSAHTLSVMRSDMEDDDDVMEGQETGEKGIRKGILAKGMPSVPQESKEIVGTARPLMRKDIDTIASYVLSAS